MYRQADRQIDRQTKMDGAMSGAQRLMTCKIDEEAEGEKKSKGC